MAVFNIAILLSLVTSVFAVSSWILPPIRENGAEVAAIFIPGANIKGEAYLDTALALQKASPLRLWVALTGNYSLDTPNPIELPKAVVGAMSELQNSGMKGDNYTGIAHSLGGVFLSAYAKSSKLKAIVLLGSYLPKTTSLKDYPLPVLTLSGELDGQARITRIVVEYEKLLEIIKTPGAVYRTPVINIPGVCHAQFASGPMPPEVAKYDLTPEVTEDQAHALIGQHVSNFLTVNFNIPTPTVVDVAKTALMHAFLDSGTRFEPLLAIKALDSVPLTLTSPWSVLCQSIIAGDLITRTKSDNEIELSKTLFVTSKPEIEKNGTGVVIKTKTFIQYDSNPLDISTVPESPQEVDIKCMSYEAIQAALNASRDVSSANTTCRELNEVAANLAFWKSRTVAQQRYKSKGRPLTFLDDVEDTTGYQWVETPLKLDEDDAGLHVQSAALKVSIHSIIFPGNFYCKTLSPYRAMEWINVDSLRAHKPN